MIHNNNIFEYILLEKKVERFLIYGIYLIFIYSTYKKKYKNF